MRLNPYYPDWYLWHLADAYYALKRYDDVIVTVHKMINPAEGGRLLAASYAQLGMHEEASIQTKDVLKLHPGFTISRWIEIQPDTVPDILDDFAEGLRKAGFPE